jgi:tryptophan halogenase
MADLAVNRFVIVGGGTAGWIAAASLGRLLLRPQAPGRSVILVESAEVGPIGVGEATVPSIQDMLRFLNIDEADFIRETDATYKLGIRFRDWTAPGSDYWHAFGELGPTIDNLPLFQHWLRERLAGGDPGPLVGLSVAGQMALHDRFAKPVKDPNAPLSASGYAYHFDAGKVAGYLRGYAEHKGVERLEGHVVDVKKTGDGAVAGLVLADGRTVEGDFFIDCSGFAALLIEKALGSPYEDWSHWLPCDRAVAMPSAPGRPLVPYTTATAQAAGWTWNIPLQSRRGHGYVWSSRFCDEETATQTLREAVGDRPLAEPRHLRFVAGRRREPWVKNCLSLGLASGFLEPLESTSIHLVFANLFRFFDHLPAEREAEPLRRAFNARCTREIEEIRDFLILHYCASPRRDSDFWRHVTAMSLPDSLVAKLDMFTRQGKLLADYYDLFRPVSWMAVLTGLGITPQRADPLADLVPRDRAQQILRGVSQAIRQTALAQPAHEAVLSALLSPSR